jgi:hypothetical protein
MDPYPPETLIELFQTSHAVIHRQLKDVTLEESLLQPPFRGNCLNWVLGHILTGRDDCLAFIDQPLVLSEDERETYKRGSEALTDPCKANSLDELVLKLDESLERLVAGLSSLSPEAMQREVIFARKPGPLGGVLAFLNWHEAYHVGQLELLRQLAGKNDQVIK